ncbi:TonB-dependent receptor [Actomonas aquatica]|uniref:TonB-dependent receptor n=1 Tax=Actomonas aquatica TaxID=2866162 RepID=A0ABZ1C649_9BACT|nr:TonB-dependent receptor [Opitutus sp. WL0086]WRQ86004.1 TonB-dependent receptor [Opitutus sp. WL0086]
MTPYLQRHPDGSRPCSRPFTALALSTLLALGLGSASALAQTTTSTAAEGPVVELDEFVVSGSFKDSMEQALAVKRANVQMVDAIVAEDIGKFPDNNVIEALQRVTGVQVTNRGGGEVSTVSIRGLNDITTTINGRNIFTASGRSVALADIPASLLRQVDVFKTRSSDLIESGIAGVIDIRTHRPFDFDGPKMGLAVRGIYQDKNDEIDPNISALFSNTWKLDSGGKFGALVNVSYAETDYRDQSVTAGAMVPFVTENPPAGWVPYERIFPTNGRVSENPIWQAGLEAGLPFTAGSTLQFNGQPVEYYLSRDAIFASDFTGHRERPAVNVSLQFSPDERSKYTFEAFYNGYRNESFNSLLFSFADWWGALGDNPEANTVVYPGTNIIKSRENIGFPYGFMSGDLRTGQTDSYLYAFTGEWAITDKFNLTADLSFQDTEFSEDFFAMRTDRVHRWLSVDFNSGGGFPAFSFGDDAATADVDESDLTNPALWNIAQLYDNAIYRKGDAASLTLDGDYEVGNDFLRALKFGVRYDNRGASEGERTQDAPGLGQNMANYPELVHINSGFFDGRSDVPTSWAVADGYYIRANADEVRNLYKSTVAPDLAVGDQLIMRETFNVDETTIAAYLSADFATYIGDRRLDGQIGLRYVDVETDMNFTDLNTSAQSSDSASTDDILPSLVVRYALTDNLRLRASYGETLRRPNFVQLNPNINYVEDVTNIGYGTATGGNPNLAPTTSKNYDLALEWYFQEASAIYATLFKREIDGLVVNFRKRVTFENYDYILSAPDNASNGELTGFELGFVYFPEDLPGLLDGFGVQASYTSLDSEQNIPITDSAGNVIGEDTTPFFAVSDSSYSVVLAYERPKFSARLSYVWREDFLNNYEAALFANPLGVYRKPETSMDLQLSYRATDKLTLTLDATNLTDEAFQSYYEYPDTHNFGSSIYSTTIAVGARYSF